LILFWSKQVVVFFSCRQMRVDVLFSTVSFTDVQRSHNTVCCLDCAVAVIDSHCRHISYTIHYDHNAMKCTWLKFKTTVFWDMMPCSLVGGYQHFWGTAFSLSEGLFYLEDRQNVSSRRLVPFCQYHIASSQYINLNTLPSLSTLFKFYNYPYI